MCGISSGSLRFERPQQPELNALLNLSSWCLVMVERLFLAVPRGNLQFVIVVFPDHTHLLFLNISKSPRFFFLRLLSIFT